MNDCIFCRIVKKDIPAQIVYEDAHCIAFLSIQPVNKGHVLLIHKHHKQDIHALNDNELQQLIGPVKVVAAAVKKATKAEGINISMNNGKAAGQEVFHAHIHIIPRYTDDHLSTWPHKTYADDMHAYSDKIRAAVKTFK